MIVTVVMSREVGDHQRSTLHCNNMFLIDFLSTENTVRLRLDIHTPKMRFDLIYHVYDYPELRIYNNSHK